MSEIESTKPCNRCKAIKLLSAFSKKRDGKHGVNGICKSCQAAASSEWRSNNAERHANYNARWRWENKQHRAWYARKWRSENAERYHEYQKSYREDNADRYAEHNRRWRLENRERALELWRANGRNRRARKVAADGSFTIAQFKKLCAIYAYRCLRCGYLCSNLTADHVTPLSKGGSDNIENIQPLCARCNSSKGTKIIDYRPCASLQTPDYKGKLNFPEDGDE